MKLKKFYEYYTDDRGIIESEDEYLYTRIIHDLRLMGYHSIGPDDDELIKLFSKTILESLTRYDEKS